MDRVNIPTCALHRQSTTVIVRIKMEVPRCCGQSEGCPVTDGPKIVHRPSRCEHCSRTRLISQYSDCDSGIVEKCRPYKSSAARSKYVNVCAAVCLLLLIGDLSPGSCRPMDRHRRASEEEDPLWGQPCGFNSPGGSYSNKAAKRVSQMAKHAFDTTISYNESFAKWHSYESFDNLQQEWKEDWLRKLPWVTQEVLPENKILFQAADDEHVHSMMDSIDSHLPAMYKTLKLILASLDRLKKNLEHDGIVPDANMAMNITKTVSSVGSGLCYFYELMKARNLEILPLYNNDPNIPDINKDKVASSIYIYRDTLNYLEYLVQVFQKMSEVVHSSGGSPAEG